MAVTAFPSYAYNSAGQPAQIVASQAAFNTLTAPGSWAFTPFVTALVTAPTDVGFSNTDIRLQQILVELRVLNLMTSAVAGNVDDPTGAGLRADVIASDVAITS